MFKVRGLSLASVAKLLSAKVPATPEVQHVFICVADHYEPKWSRPSKQTEWDRVERWANGFPLMAQGITDSRGRAPQHSFFYPEEEYEPQYLDAIAKLCRQGYGDVEIHLHHDKDTEDGLREKLGRFTNTLHNNHGLLKKNAQGQLTFAFIHGNWALNNSNPHGRMCGVNNETSILKEMGCYADFTMPSAPDPCQTSTINQIYYAKQIPDQPKSHDTGRRASVGTHPASDELLMIQGPLALDWSSRKWGLIPRIENGDLTKVRPPTLARLQLWRTASVQVANQSDWLFVKLHTHGAQEKNASMLLGEPMRNFHLSLRDYAAQNSWFRYYYVTAREMAQLVHAAEAGQSVPSFNE